MTFTEFSKEEAFSGRVYKIGHDSNGTRVTYIKALSGKLKVREELCYGDEKLCEKITGIRIYNGNKFKTVNEVCAGEVFAVTGLSNASAGDGLGNLKEKAEYQIRDMVILNL